MRRANRLHRESLTVTVIQEVTRKRWISLLDRQGISLNFQVSPQFVDQQAIDRCRSRHGNLLGRDRRQGSHISVMRSRIAIKSRISAVCEPSFALRVASD